MDVSHGHGPHDQVVGGDGAVVAGPGIPVLQERPVIVGLAGGSGSGKSTVVGAIVDALGPETVAVLPHDAYYHDLSNVPVQQRQALNFDHPNAFDDELFTSHLRALRRGEAVEVPTYDFAAHTRADRVHHLQPRPVVLAEGILLFASATLRDLLDVKVFVDTEADLRLLRRLRRDVAERGRTVESVLSQYEDTVRPMHLEFVEPSKRWADVLIPHGGRNAVAIDMVVRALRESLA